MVMVPLPSEAFGADQHRHQIDEKAERGQRGEPQVERHISPPSRIVAQADEGERQRHQADHDRHPQQILHRGLPQKLAVSEASTVPFAIDPRPSCPLLKLGCRYAASRRVMSVSTHDRFSTNGVPGTA